MIIEIGGVDNKSQSIIGHLLYLGFNSYYPGGL